MSASLFAHPDHTIRADAAARAEFLGCCAQAGMMPPALEPFAFDAIDPPLRRLAVVMALVSGGLALGGLVLAGLVQAGAVG